MHSGIEFTATALGTIVLWMLWVLRYHDLKDYFNKDFGKTVLKCIFMIIVFVVTFIGTGVVMRSLN